jgi:hypothetical protein
MAAIEKASTSAKCPSSTIIPSLPQDIFQPLASGEASKSKILDETSSGRER